MANRDARGTKRTCQNSACGSRFYDLNNSPIVCPICDSPYVIASAPGFVPPSVVEEAPKARKVEPATDDAPADTVEPEAEVSLGEIADAEEALADDEEEAPFIEEEEEDGGDVSGLIGDVGEGEEEP